MIPPVERSPQGEVETPDRASGVGDAPGTPAVSPSYACAQRILAQLAAQGVTDVVVCPGSRSAPLALAAVEAERLGVLRLHVRTDERTAGFLALGLAKASGRPAAVVTTSGTAVGNLLPAVMEAHHGEVPLIVVSADRPASLVGTGASQTTDQVGIFGRFVQFSARLSSAAPAASWGAQTAMAAVRALGTGTGAGPVHLNIEFSEPLIPGGAETWPLVEPLVDRTSVMRAAVELSGGVRTVVVCGDARPERGAEAVAFAELAGVPLIAEPTSGARRGPALACGRLLLGTPLADEIERVIVFGHPTLSRPVNRLLGRPDVEVVVVSPEGAWPDPGWRAGLLAPSVSMPPGDPAWLGRWQAADADASAHVAAVLATARTQDVPLLGWDVAASVWRAAAGEPLVVGASQVIRDLDLVAIADEPPLALANRGLAGIDGTVSTAVGVALASGRPTTCVLGDLTLLHDANGLAIGPGERRPDVRFVVLDDAGGAIFATLEYGDARFGSSFERVFGTPSGVDLAALAASYGATATRVGSLAELDAALAAPPSGVEVIVVPVDRARRRELTQAMGRLGD